MTYAWSYDHRPWLTVAIGESLITSDDWDNHYDGDDDDDDDDLCRNRVCVFDTENLHYITGSQGDPLGHDL